MNLAASYCPFSKRVQVGSFVAAAVSQVLFCGVSCFRMECKSIKLDCEVGRSLLGPCLIILKIQKLAFVFPGSDWLVLANYYLSVDNV